VVKYLWYGAEKEIHKAEKKISAGWCPYVAKPEEKGRVFAEGFIGCGPDSCYHYPPRSTRAV